MLGPSTAEHENSSKLFPSWEGQGPSGPGVGLWRNERPTPALRATPPRRGFSWALRAASLEVLHQHQITTGFVDLGIQYRPPIGRNRYIPSIRQVPFGSKDRPPEDADTGAWAINVVPNRTRKLKKPWP